MNIKYLNANVKVAKDKNQRITIMKIIISKMILTNILDRDKPTSEE